MTLQSHVWIDPLNRTTAATDANSGAAPTVPVRSWQGGVLGNLFGRRSRDLPSSITFHFLSASPTDGSDPVAFSPVHTGDSFVRFEGTFDDHNRFGSGILAGVVAKSRATGQVLEADLGTVPGAAAGMVLVNTTGGKSSRCHVLSNVAGTVFSLTQPQTISDQWPLTGDPLPVDSYADGDTFDLYLEDLVDFVRLEPIATEYDPIQANEFCVVTNLGVLDPQNTKPGLYVGDGVAFLYAQIGRRVVFTRSGLDRSTLFFGCLGDSLLGGALDVGGKGNKLWLSGGAWRALAGVGIYLDQDVILRGANSRIQGGLVGACCVDAGAALELVQGIVLQDSGFGAAIWGRGALDDDLGRLSILGTTAAASLLVSGGLTISGSASVFSASAANPSTVNGAVALTPAAIDAAGMLYMPGGGAIRIG